MKRIAFGFLSCIYIACHFCHAAPSGATTAPTAALPGAPILKLLTDNNAATGSAQVSVLTSGTTYGNLYLNCSIPASDAQFAIISGAQRNIAGGSAIGPNDPPIALRCTPLASVATATLSCQQSPTPEANLPPLTATVVCPPRPVALVDPTTALDFGALSVGQSTTQDVLLNNHSTLTANVIGCEMSGLHSADFFIAGSSSLFPLTIAPGSSARLPVRFTASIPTGAKQASLACHPGADTLVNGLTELRAIAAPPPREAVDAIGAFGTLTLGFGVLSLALLYRR